MLLTNHSQAIHSFIHNPADMAFLEAWHRFGTTSKPWPRKYLGKEAAYEGLSALGICAKLACTLGREGKSWRSVCLTLKRATLAPSNLPGQCVKVAHKAS